MSCPMCDNNNLYFSCECPTRQFEREGTGIASVTYLGCTNCGLVFQQESLPDDYYRAAYRTNLPAHSETVRDGNVRGEHKRAAKMDEYLMLWGVVPASVLDVGSATGELLRYMQHKYGCWIEGVEPSDAFREYANQQGTRTVAVIEDGTWDLVTCVHVLEHIATPKQFLASLKARVGRFLYLEVPHISPKLPHALLFTLESLVKIIEMAGFKVLHKAHSEDDNNLRVLCAPG